MPHITVRIRTGIPVEKKKTLADAIVDDVVNIVGSGRQSISVAIEEVDPKDWQKKVYDPYIRSESNSLYIKPGYSM